MVTSTPPANYLAYGVTDLNRQSLWNALTDEGRAKYSSASTSTGTSTGGTSTTGTSTGGTSTTGTSTGSTSTTSTKPKGFTSLSSANTLSATAFDNRIDSRSSAVLKETRVAFSNLWGGDSLLQAQLTTQTNPDTGVSAPPNGGAIFVTYKLGSVATQTRPYDGAEGDINLPESLPRGKNPFGYFSTDPAMADTPFVQQIVGTDGSVKEVTYDPDSGQKYSDWQKAARNRYDQYEALVGDQMNKVMSSFGSIGDQGLLGFDVNNNGFIDDESELFGFDNGLNIDGSSTIKLANGTSQEFTFLTGNRLTGDPLDAEQETDRTLYRRFMMLGANGSSTSVLQSSTGYNASLGQYVTAQAMLTFDSGGARMTTVAQNGFQVTA